MLKAYKRNLSLILSSRLISLLGTGIQAIAIPLYILDKTQSGTLVGIFSAVSIIPLIIASVYAGIIGDRLNKKNILITTDILSAAVIGIMALNFFNNFESLALLFIFQAIASILESFYLAASISIIPEMFSDEILGRVNGFRGGADNIAMALGPVLGSVLYGLLGIKYVFVINAFSFLSSGLCQIFITYRQEGAKPEHSSLQIKDQLKEVLTYINGNSPLKQLFIMVVLINLFDFPIAGVVIPYLFKKVIGVGNFQYGLIQSSLIFGMLLGNIIFTYFLFKKPVENVFKKSLLFQYVITIFFSFISLRFVFRFYDQSGAFFIGAVVVLLLPIGMLNAICNTIIITNLQKLVPRELMSRFFSIAQIIFQIANPVGVLLFGILLDRFPTYFVMFGIAIILMFIVVLFIKKASSEVYNPEINSSR